MMQRASPLNISHLARTSCFWPPLASAPMPTSFRRGSPIAISSNAARSASATGWRSASGTRIRRTAVHFCPALAVISPAASLMKRSNSGSPTITSGPRMVAFSESCSAENRTDLSSRFGVPRSITPVTADPVKLTASCGPSISRSGPSRPETNCTAPSGRRPDSMIIRKAASVR